MLNRRPLFVAILFCVAVGFAQATPPWFTDWVRTVPWKHLVTRIAFVTTYKPNQHRTELPRFQLSYGLTPRSELIFKASELDLFRGTKSSSGVSDAQIGYKRRIIDRTDGWQAGFNYFLSVPTGAPSLGTGSNGYDQSFAFLGGRRFKDGQQIAISLGANVYGRSTGKANATAGILYTRSYAHNLMVGAEVDANTAQKSGSRSDLTWGVGFTKLISPTQSLLARVGRSTQGFSSLNLFLGLQLDWKP